MYLHSTLSINFEVQQKTHNKRVNLAHCVRWTAVPLQMCGFAPQNFTTHLQSHIRRLRGRLISARYKALM